MYTIEKVLNSSVVLANNEDGKKFILLGKGIGYGKKTGMIINKQSVEQIFIPVDNKELDRINYLVNTIPPKLIEVTQDIITYAQNVLNVNFNDSLYFILADHLNFAIKRYIENIKITNKVFWEIKNFYSKEFAVGLYALKLINTKFNITLPEEEAANIVFHLINAQNEKEESLDAMKSAKLVGVVVNIVKYSLNTKIDAESIHYSRFITHIKYFVERFFSNKLLDDNDNTLYEQMKNKYEEAFLCAMKIDEYFHEKYQLHLPFEEMAYLVVHIQRLNAVEEQF
ncbi:BglG family transcription antiterminator LicT [Anaerosacchariphilus polymeriproducens]|uniref:PRD domain-containing protein n=1 Tax=Anaerosacchariphilus polymeriproducens TaxID=1812858 RepID=A0A371AYJ9_9FIRM|nr:PRD domain-containing protein [Anaerosacchariphilus polymeriproducens]RDU24674.1 PRD domain-containing protein [Anaerosacchariphilus polymeriproducens]